MPGLPVEGRFLFQTCPLRLPVRAFIFRKRLDQSIGRAVVIELGLILALELGDDPLRQDLP